MSFGIQVREKPSTNLITGEETPGKYKSTITDRFKTKEEAVEVAKRLYPTSDWQIVNEKGEVVHSVFDRSVSDELSVSGGKKRRIKKTRSKRINKRRYTKRK